MFQNIPEQFVDEHGNDIPEEVSLLLPNGTQCYVRFNREEKIFHHIGYLLKLFDARFGGSMLCSQYNDGIFKTYIFNDNGCEIEYPNTVLQRKGNASYQGISSKFLL